MENNDRELYLYKILSGVVKTKLKDKHILVLPPTMELYLESCEHYEYCLFDYVKNGVPEEDELINFCIEKEIWSWHEEKDIESIRKQIEDTKLKMYEVRRNKALRNRTKNILENLKLKIFKLATKRSNLISNSAEYSASIDKLHYLIRNSCYLKSGENIYIDNDKSIESIVYDYNLFHNVDDFIIRYLSRNDPWRSIYTTSKSCSKSFFLHQDRELTFNQKSLLHWTQIYDSVNESMDCPDRYVIEDDDLLDGWMIMQNRKREKDKSQQDLDNSISSDKIKNSQEVFSVVGNDKEQRAAVESLNNPHARGVKNQRFKTMDRVDGPTNQGVFMDEKLKLEQKSNQKFKGKFGGK